MSAAAPQESGPAGPEDFDFDPGCMKCGFRMLQDGRCLACGHDNEADWPEPVNLFAELAAPPFTGAELPTELASYALLYAAQTGIDASIALTAAVACAAAAIPDQIQICADSASDWFAQARLWLLRVGAPGSGKTPADRAMTAPLWGLHRQLNDGWVSDTAALGEKDEKPPRPRVIVTDATLEKLSDVLAENPRGVCLVAEEFDGWLGQLDQYRSGAVGRDRAEWLQLFDGGPHQIERVKRGTTFVPNWGASILTASTPATMQRLTKHLPEDGLMQRFLVALVRRQIIVPDAPDRARLESEKKRYTELIERLYAISPRAHRGVVSFSYRAKERFDSWRSENLLLQETLGTLDPALEAHIAKYPTLALRLALTFHCARIVQISDPIGRDPAAFALELDTLEIALRFLHRASQHALALYLGRKGGSETYELARSVGRFLLAHGGIEVRRRDLVQRVSTFRAADEPIQAAVLRLLEDLGWLRVAPARYDKPQPTRWAVNPELRDRFAAIAEREKQHRAIARDRIAEAAEQRREERRGEH